ncbi:MAG TPA: transposase [Mycobacteriales bacterium]|jgi:transposase|nr:transposase [Mycobacteriales bacterium]
MPQNFITADVDQGFLLAPDVREWLPESDLAWCVRDVVAELDLGPFYRSYRADGHGRAAFDPALMVGVLCYAYAVGVRSSRAIERCCERDVAFRVLAGNLQPDHASVARFRARHEAALAGLFAQVLRLCQEAGMLALGQIAVDGTKIAANASWSRNYTEAALDHQLDEAQARFEVIAAELVAEHAATDTAEEALFGAGRGDELPAGLTRSQDRIARLRAAKDRLAGQREALQAVQETKKAAWQARQDAGRVGGRRPADGPPRTSTARSGKAPRANSTDPDSRAMRCRHTLLQGYNAQAAVSEQQLVVGAGLTQAPVDQGLLHQVLDITRGQLVAAGITPALSTVTADAGYASEDTFVRGEAAGLHVLAPVISDEDRARGADPAGRRDLGRYPATARAQAKLRTPQGQRHYAQRGRTVEPVFGQIKTVQGFRQFSRRGLAACESEWLLVCAAHNLRKLHKKRNAGR